MRPKENKKFRVVAIRHNGERAILDEFISIEDAERLRDSLPPCGFKDVRIEPDDPESKL